MDIHFISCETIKGKRGKRGKTGYTGVSYSSAATGATGPTGYNPSNEFDSIYVNNLYEYTAANNIIFNDPVVLSGFTGNNISTAGGIYAEGNIDSQQYITSENNFLIYPETGYTGVMIFSNGSPEEQRWNFSLVDQDNLRLGYYDNNGETSTDLLTMYRGSTGIYFHQGINLPTLPSGRSKLADYSITEKEVTFSWGAVDVSAEIITARIGRMITVNVPSLYFSIGTTGSNSIISAESIFDNTSLNPSETAITASFYTSDSTLALSNVELNNTGIMEITKNEASTITSSAGLTAHPFYLSYTIND